MDKEPNVKLYWVYNILTGLVIVGGIVFYGWKSLPYMLGGLVLVAAYKLYKNKREFDELWRKHKPQ